MRAMRTPHAMHATNETRWAPTATRIGALVVSLALGTIACKQSSPSVDGASSADVAVGIDGKPGVTPLGLSCSPGVDPANGLLTDFSAATYNTARARWGIEGNLTGSSYSYKDSDSTITSKVDNETLSLSGQVANGGPQDSYAGVGLQFDTCVNTVSATGIQFDFSGTSTCEIYFQVQTYAQQPTPTKGGCASYCYKFPQKKVVPQATPVTVLFSDLTNTGVPAAAAELASQIVGVRWQVQHPTNQDGGQNPCPFNLAIDDVRFVR